MSRSTSVALPAQPVAPAQAARSSEGDTNTTSLFECRGIDVSFGGLKALSDVSVRVDEGEIVGMIGPNGAGKTTLFNVISGFLVANSGKVLLDGRDLTGLLPYERARLGLGRTFQQALLYRDLSVLENLLIASHRHTRRGLFSNGLRLGAAAREEREALERARATMDVVDLTPYWEKKAGALSYGTLRMLELACMLVQAPRFVLLDEPASGIAQRETEALGPLLRRIREQMQTTILIIEHDIPMVSGLSDRMYAMDLGKVIAEGAPAQVLAHPEVVASYLGRPETVGLEESPKPARRRPAPRRTAGAPRGGGSPT
ncbi:MAG: ABC transporter ATP-binding protein [Actinomycetota bacterium]